MENLTLILGGVIGAVGAVCVALSLNRRAPDQAKVAPVRPAFVKFLGEQDGPRERALKAALAQFFQTDGGMIRKAYLARIDIGENHTVALCLKANPLPDESYPERIGELFVKVMGPGGNLDVLFLAQEHEIEIDRVCRPFYEPPNRTA